MVDERTGSAVRPIEQADQDQVVGILARAFEDDPAINHIVKQDGRRAERIHRMFDVALKKLTFQFGETYVTEGFEGAALWNPPGKRPSGIVADLKLLPQMIRIAGFGGLRRAIATFDLLEKRHPKVPHYYLPAIGVEPSLQGKGVGTSLLAPMTARLDAERMPAYLESSKEQNLPLYQRHGFAVTEQVQLPHDGPPAWLMWREPQ